MSRKIFLLFVLAATLPLCCCPAVFFFPTSSATPTITPDFILPLPTSPEFLPTPTTPSLDIFSPFSYAWDDLSPFIYGLLPHAQSVLEELSGATVYHLALRLQHSTEPRQRPGRDSLYEHRRHPLSEIYLALFPNLLGGSLRVQATALNGRPVYPRFSDGWLMMVPLDPPLLPGEALTLRITFQVNIPTGGGSYYHGIFGYNQGILSLAHAYPTVLVYDEEGWNNQPLTWMAIRSSLTRLSTWSPSRRLTT